MPKQKNIENKDIFVSDSDMRGVEMYEVASVQGAEVVPRGYSLRMLRL